MKLRLPLTLLSAVLAVACVNLNAFADTKTWTGDGLWSDTSKWDNGLPATEDTVAITTDATLTVDGSYSVAAITLSNTNSKTFLGNSSSSHLTVTGNFTLTGSSVTLGNGTDPLKITTGQIKGVRSTVTVNSGVDIETARFALGDGNGAAGTLDLHGGKIVVTGDDNGTAGASRSFILGHWSNNAFGTLNVYSGSIESRSAIATVSWDAAGNINLYGGVMTANGVQLSVNARTLAATVTLDGGRLNIGPSGLMSTNGSNKTYLFKKGTLGTYADWSTSANITLGEEQIIIDTLNIDDNSTGQTLTFTGTLSGAGGITKVGEGTLILNGKNLYEGETIINQGILSLNLYGAPTYIPSLTIGDGATVLGLRPDNIPNLVSIGSNTTILWQGDSLTQYLLGISHIGTGNSLIIDLATQSRDVTIAEGIVGGSDKYFDKTKVGIKIADGYNNSGDYIISDEGVTQLEILYSDSATGTLTPGNFLTFGNSTYTLSADGTKVSVNINSLPPGHEEITWAQCIASTGKAPIYADAVTVQAGSSNYFSISPSDYTFTDINGDLSTRIKITGPSDGTANVYGGSHFTGVDGTGGRDIVGDIWMSVEGGKFETIGGGSLSYWNADRTSYNLTGDIYLQVIGDTTADRIIGSYTEGAYNASRRHLGNVTTFIGEGVQVTNNIVGHSHESNQRKNTHTGQVYLELQSVQSSSGYLVGANLTSGNADGGHSLIGDVDVVLNLGNGSGNFGKVIVGSNAYTTNGTGHTAHATHTGNVRLVINASDNVTFAENIIGGTFSNVGNGTLNLTGNASITLNGGSYAGAIYAGSVRAREHETSLFTLSGSSTLTINGGIFNSSAKIYGGGSLSTSIENTAKIILQGNDFAFDDNVEIHAGGLGQAALTEFEIKNISGGSFLNFTGSIYGSSKTGTVHGAKSLFFDNSNGVFQASFRDFDDLYVDKGSIITLVNAIDGLTNIKVSGNSTLSYGEETFSLSSLYVDSGSTFSLGGNTYASLTVRNNMDLSGIISMRIGDTGSDKLTYSGTDALTGVLNFHFNFGTVEAGNEFVLFSVTGDLDMDGVTFLTSHSVVSGARDVAYTFLADADGKNAVLKITGGGIAVLTWASGTTAWQENLTSALWDTTATDKYFYANDRVIFNDAAGSNQTVTVNGTVTASSITFDNGSYDYILTGGTINSLGNVTKDGSHSATLTNTTLNISGDLNLLGGALVAGNGSSLILNGSYTLNGGTYGLTGGTLNLEDAGSGDSVLAKFSQISGGTIVFGDRSLLLQASSSTLDFSLITYSGTGALIADGDQSIWFGDGGQPAGGVDLYSGSGAGLTVTGTHVRNIFGGSPESQTEPIGKIVIGSTNSATTTDITGKIHAVGIVGNTLGSTDGLALTQNPWNSTSYNYSVDIKNDIVSEIVVQGSATMSQFLNSDGTINTAVFNTKITGAIYGGAISHTATGGGSNDDNYKEGSIIYGSTNLTLSGIHYDGSTATDRFGQRNYLVAGAGSFSRIYGNATLTVKNSYIDATVFGTLGNVTGEILLDFENSYFTSNIYVSTANSRSYAWSSSTLKDSGSIFAGNIIGGLDTRGNSHVGRIRIDLTNSVVKGYIQGGITDEKHVYGVEISLTDSLVDGYITAGSAHNRWTRGYGLIDIHNSTVDAIYAGGVGSYGIEKSGNYTANLTVNISGNNTSIGKFWGVGNDNEYGQIQGDVLINISGGTIGAGLTGSSGDMFMVGGQNVLLHQNASVYVSGGEVLNEFFNFSGSGAGAGDTRGIGGDFLLCLSDTGIIESQLRAVSGSYASIAGDVNIVLEGGTLGLAGQTRSIDMGAAEGAWAVNPHDTTVKGDVSIIIDGDSTVGLGTTFLGDYSILAGATLHGGTGVAGDTSVILKNITAKSADGTGFAHFNGLISGANATGGGVAANSDRTLVFSNYKTEASAVFKYFSSAEVRDDSNVFLTQAGNSSIDHWSILGNSSLNITTTDSLGGAGTMSLETGSRLVIINNDIADFTTVLTGGGSLVLASGSMVALNITSNNASFTGNVIIETGNLLKVDGSGYLGSGNINVAGGATLTFSQFSDQTLSNLLSGGGIINIDTASSVKTQLTNTASDFSGNVNVQSGQLELANGVELSGADANVSSGAILSVHASSLDMVFNQITGAGTISLGTNTSLSGSGLGAFTGTLVLENNRTLTITDSGTSPLAQSQVTLSLQENTLVEYNNDSASNIDREFNTLVLSNAGNVIRFEGGGTELSFVSDGWLNGSGEITFDFTNSVDSRVKAGIDSLGAYSNVFIIEDGITYLAQTNSLGYLSKISIEYMEELPEGGQFDSSMQPYRITGSNPDLVGMTLTMTGDTEVALLTIESASGVNEKWDLVNQSVDLTSGLLFFQGDADYTITGGTLTGKANEKFLINQTAADQTLTIESEITDTSSGSEVIQKSGPGNLVLSGALSNTGGLIVDSGTLQLSGNATGSATSGTLVNQSQASLILGDGVTYYQLGYTSLTNMEGGTATLNSASDITAATTVQNNGRLIISGTGSIDYSTLTNDGILEFRLDHSVRLLEDTLIGSGSVAVNSSASGILSVSALQTQAFDVGAGASVRLELTSTADTAGAITGQGNVFLNNDSTGHLDLDNTRIGSDWSAFEGTLILGSLTNNTMRVGFTEIIGADAGDVPTIEVREGSQFHDLAASSSTRKNNWILTGNGHDGSGALNVQDGAAYSGTVTVDTDGASIGGSSGTATFSGNISGGILSLGMTSASTLAVELSGTNTHDGTRILQGTVNAESASALGRSVELAYGTSVLNINTSVTTGTLNGTQAGSTVNLASGATLSLDGASSSTFNGIISGAGHLALDGDGTVTLGGNNTFTGDLDVLSGTLAATSAAALGAVTADRQVTIHTGAVLNLSGRTSTHLITALSGSSLTGMSAFGGTLTIGSGAMEDRVAITGNLQAGSLVLEASSWAAVTGDVLVTNGGRLKFNAANAGSDNAMVNVGGSASLGGEFKISFNTNDYYNDSAVTYYVMNTASGNVTDFGGLDFTLEMSTAYQRFFTLDGDYLNNFLDTGKLTVTVNRLVVEGHLIYNHQGGDHYTAGTPIHYLGAAEDQNVRFFARYTMADSDDSYRLTNGLGWLTFDSETTLVDKDPGNIASALIINEYMTDLDITDRGVVMKSKVNTFTDGTHIFNVHVKSDADGALDGLVQTFSTGEISILGEKSHFELTTSASDTSSAYTYNNGFILTDGAVLSQSIGTHTLTGDVFIADDAAASTIMNTGDEDLVLEGGLYGGELFLKGGSDGRIVLAGDYATQSQRNLQSLTVLDGLTFGLENQASLRVGNVEIEGGSDITIGTGTTLTLYGGSATGDGNIILDGGTLRVTRNLILNGAGNASIVFNAPLGRVLVSGNAIDVVTGTSLTINDPTAAAGTSFTKIGEGTLIFDGDNSRYYGTAIVLEGTMNINANTFNFGGNVEIGGGDTEAVLNVVDGVIIQGSMTVNNNARLVTGNNFTVDNAFILADNAVFETDGKVTLKGDVIVGSNGKLTLAEGTTLGYDGTTISFGQGSILNFGSGKGSQLAGVMSGPLAFTSGSSYEGFLNANANSVIFEAGSSYIISGSLKFKEAGSVTGALQSKETVTLNEGMTFVLDNFTEDNLGRYENGFTLISVSGMNGRIEIEDANGNKTALVEDEDYSRLLGTNSYDWIQFGLLGGASGKTLDLDLYIRANYELIGKNANERAIAPNATHLANNFSKYDGELKSLGAALALASGDSAQRLSALSLSTSSAMAGYQVQMANLKRHSFDILNRASQEFMGSERLTHEQYYNTVWANGIGGTYKLSGDGENALGNTTTVWGGTVGYSRAVTEFLNVGAAFTYTDSDTDIERGMGKVNSDAYYIDVFARYNRNNWNAIGILTGGMTSIDTERNLTVGEFSGRGRGSADGHQIYATVQLGYEFSLTKDDRTLLEPFALISGGYSSLDGYTESGLGNAGLIVDSQSQGMCTIGAGVRLSHTFFTNTNHLYKGRFEFRALVLQDLTDMDVPVDAGFIGAPSQRFSQEGATAGRTAFVVGTGVVLPVTSQVSLFGDVDGEFRNSETGVRANIGVKISF